MLTIGPGGRMIVAETGEPVACGQAGEARRLHYGGRSVRCGDCMIIAVHPYGDTSRAYVHWTDAIPGDGNGRRWIDVATREGSPAGRLHVPASWA